MAVQSNIGRFCSVWNNCKHFLNTRKMFINSQPTIAFSSKSINELTDKVKNLNIPEKPKRPLTPYFRYMLSARSDIKSKNPDVSAKEIVKLSAAQWETADQQLKDKYKEEFKLEQKDYAKQILAYEAKLTPEQRQTLLDLRKASSDRIVKLRVKREIRSLGRPKRSPSPFMFYVKDHLDERGSLSYTGLQKKLAEKWRTLSPEQQKPYFAKCEERRNEYQKEMQEWELRMIKEGHSDVIRKSQSLLTSARTQKKNKVTKQ